MTDWQTYLRENIEVHAVAAWYGYQHRGRGVLVVNFQFADRDDNGTVIRMPMEYLTVDDLVVEERGGWPVTQVPDVIRRYDPETQMVVLVILPNEGAHVTRMGPLPIKRIYEERMAKQAIFGHDRGH